MPNAPKSMIKRSGSLDAPPMVNRISNLAARVVHKMDRRAQLVPALSALAIVLLQPEQGHAAMYRWVDQNGVTIYSQSPPPGGAATEISKDPEPRITDIEAARARLRRQLEKEFDEHEAEAEKIAMEARERESARKDHDACATARKNLETIQNLGARRAITPEGDAVYLSDEQRQNLMDKAGDQIRKTCR